MNSSDQILGLLLKKERKPFLDLGLDIWMVTAIDGMIADFVQIPWDVLQKISVRIVSEVKPPATIEYG